MLESTDEEFFLLCSKMDTTSNILRKDSIFDNLCVFVARQATPQMDFTVKGLHHVRVRTAYAPTMQVWSEKQRGYSNVYLLNWRPVEAIRHVAVHSDAIMAFSL